MKQIETGSYVVFQDRRISKNSIRKFIFDRENNYSYDYTQIIELLPDFIKNHGERFDSISSNDLVFIKEKNRFHIEKNNKELNVSQHTGYFINYLVIPSIFVDSLNNYAYNISGVDDILLTIPNIDKIFNDVILSMSNLHYYILRKNLMYITSLRTIFDFMMFMINRYYGNNIHKKLEKQIENLSKLRTLQFEREKTFHKFSRSLHNLSWSDYKITDGKLRKHFEILNTVDGEFIVTPVELIHYNRHDFQLKNISDDTTGYDPTDPDCKVTFFSAKPFHAISKQYQKILKTRPPEFEPISESIGEFNEYVFNNKISDQNFIWNLNWFYQKEHYTKLRYPIFQFMQNCYFQRCEKN